MNRASPDLPSASVRAARPVYAESTRESWRRNRSLELSVSFRPNRHTGVFSARFAPVRATR